MELLVARIGKPHGLRGEATVQSHTDSPEERFTPGAVFTTQPAGMGPLTLRSARQHKGTWLLGFEEADDRSAIEALRNTRLYVDVDIETARAVIESELDPTQLGENEPGADMDFSPLEPGPEDGWYEDELVGLAVETVAGEKVGTVLALHTRPMQDLLEVRLPGGANALIPFVDEIVPEVDVEARIVRIDPPEGLLDLAREDMDGGRP